MDCPRCGLANPPTGTICDCGFNFAKGVTGQPLSLAQLPGGVLAVAWLSLIVITIAGLVRLLSKLPARPEVRFGFGAVLPVLVWWLYFKYRAGRNWARIWFGVLTVPIGLVHVFSERAKLYCKQRGSRT